MDQERQDAGLRHDRICGRRPRRDVPRRGAVSGSRRAAACVRRPEDRQSGLRIFLCPGRIFRNHRGRRRDQARHAAAAVLSGPHHSWIGDRSRRTADRARFAHDISPRRELSAADHLRLPPDVSGCVSLSVGRDAAHHGQRLSRLRHRAYSGSSGADLQSAGDRGKSCHRGGARAFSRADQHRTYRARHRGKPRHGRGARRQRLENLRTCFHRGLHAGHGWRCARGSVRRGIAGYGG